MAATEETRKAVDAKQTEARRQQIIAGALEYLRIRRDECFHHKWNPVKQTDHKSHCPCGEYMGGY